MYLYPELLLHMQMRRKQIRNALLMLFLSQGTPLLMMGDEFGRTKKGNNNSYCQDNDISWLNWGLLNSNSSIHEFVKHVIPVSYTHLDVYKRQVQDDDIRRQCADVG